jgi:nucleotide-binding universal stress UspA family protein
MSKVLAALDNSAAAKPVLSAAAAVARLLGAEIEAVHAPEDGFRTAQAAADAAGVPLRVTAQGGIPGLLAAASEDAVVMLALGARSTHAGRRPAGRVALEFARSVRKPLVLVPPDASLPITLGRILVPLDGTRATDEALAATVQLACRSALDVIALHVHEYADLPLFSDQPQYEADAWAREFLRRHCPRPDLVALETRVGVPGQHVLRVAHDAAVDMVALGWSRHLEEGRAAVVRDVLAGSSIPVLLVPIDALFEDERPPAVEPAAALDVKGAGRR